MTGKTKKKKVGKNKKSEEIEDILKKTNSVSITGFPNPTSQAYYITKNQSLNNKVIFWLLKKEKNVRGQPFYLGTRKRSVGERCAADVQSNYFTLLFCSCKPERKQL